MKCKECGDEVNLLLTSEKDNDGYVWYKWECESCAIEFISCTNEDEITRLFIEGTVIGIFGGVGVGLIIGNVVRLLWNLK